jgi:hypothetical protein
MDEILKSILVSGGVSAVLLAGLVLLSKDWLTERLSRAVQHEYDRKLEAFTSELKARADTALEAHKAELEHRTHIVKSQFDMEFNAFKSVWSSQCTLVDATTRLINAYLDFGLDGNEKVVKEHATAADTAFFQATKISREMRPFMPDAAYQQSFTVAKRCKEEVDYFFHALQRKAASSQFVEIDEEAARDQTRKNKQAVLQDYESLAATIRMRLESLTSGPISSTRAEGDA